MRGIPYFRTRLRDPGVTSGSDHIIAFYVRFQLNCLDQRKAVTEDGMPPFHSIIVKRNNTKGKVIYMQQSSRVSDKPKTNADRIRSFSDEELAEFIEQVSTDSMETISFGTKEYEEIWEHKETALQWLRSEVEE